MLNVEVFGGLGAEWARIDAPPSVLLKTALELGTNEQLRAASLIRRVRRSPNMQVAQISQRRPVVLAHPAREVRIVQPLVARRFRHILQHAQSLLNRLPALWRHLSPSRQHIIAHVVALLRGHLLPDLRSLAQLLLLLWGKPPELSFILLKSPPFFRREFSRASRRIRRTVPIDIRPLHALPSHIRRAIPRVARVSRSPRKRIRCGRIARRIEVAARRFSITARRFGNPRLWLYPARFLPWLAALLPRLLPPLLV